MLEMGLHLSGTIAFSVFHRYEPNSAMSFHGCQRQSRHLNIRPAESSVHHQILLAIAGIPERCVQVPFCTFYPALTTIRLDSASFPPSSVACIVRIPPSDRAFSRPTLCSSFPHEPSPFQSSSPKAPSSQHYHIHSQSHSFSKPHLMLTPSI